MPIAPRKGRTFMLLVFAFFIVVLGAIYFKAESGATAALTLSGAKNLASYKEEMETKKILESDSPLEGSTDSDRGGMSTTTNE